MIVFQHKLDLSIFCISEESHLLQGQMWCTRTFSGYANLAGFCKAPKRYKKANHFPRHELNLIELDIKYWLGHIFLFTGNTYFGVILIFCFICTYLVWPFYIATFGEEGTSQMRMIRLLEKKPAVAVSPPALLCPSLELPARRVWSGYQLLHQYQYCSVIWVFH